MGIIAIALVCLLGWFIYEHAPYGKPIIGTIAILLMLKLLGIVQYPIIAF